MRRIIIAAAALAALTVPAVAQAHPLTPGYPAASLPAAHAIPHNQHRHPALYGTHRQHAAYRSYMRQIGWTPVRYGRMAEHSHNPAVWLWTYRLWLHRARWAHKMYGRYYQPPHPSGSVESIIDQVFGSEAPAARAVAACESGFNPDAYNPSGATGVFQLMPFWWDGGNAYGWVFNPRDPYENIYHAYLISGHGTNWGDWVCQP